MFHTANGTPLYAPFHLSQTIPAMMLAHLTIAGLCEFAVTAGILAYLQRANVPLLRINHANVPVTDEELVKKRMGWRWAMVGLATLIVITPLGLLAPGGAFGEDAPADLDLSKYGLSAVPTGLNKFSSFWSHTVLGGYGFQDGQHPVIGYLLSAVVGIVIIGAFTALFIWVARFFMRRRGRDDDGAEPDVTKAPA